MTSSVRLKSKVSSRTFEDWQKLRKTKHYVELINPNQMPAKIISCITEKETQEVVEKFRKIARRIDAVYASTGSTANVYLLNNYKEVPDSFHE